MSARIDKQVDLEAGLTIYTVKGKVPAEEYTRTIRDFYEQGPVTKNVLWDLTESDLDHLSTADVQEIGRVPHRFAPDRAGGKTAVVAPSDLAFGLARMYEFTSDSAERSFTVNICRSMHEAMQWLAAE